MFFRSATFFFLFACLLLPALSHSEGQKKLPFSVSASLRPLEDSSEKSAVDDDVSNPVGSLHRLDLDHHEICRRGGGIARMDLKLAELYCSEAEETEETPSVYVMRSKEHSPQAPQQESKIQALRIRSEEFSGRLVPPEKYDTLTAIMGFTFGLVLFVPENLGGWTQDRKDRIKEGVGGAWKNNLKTGFVMDKDPHFINYVLHPYSGAAYYMIARRNGQSALASFAFAVLMSTQWEILETIGEPLSIQDLFATPILGALLGEFFYHLHSKISANPVFAESFLGKVVLFFIDPIDGVSKGVDQFAKKLWGPKARGRVEMFVSGGSSPNSTHRSEWIGIETIIGARIRFSY